MKPGAFTRMYVHIVFAVRFREGILSKETRIKVFEYVTGILRNLGHKPLIVGGYKDHMHILIGLNPSVSVSDTVHAIKRSSSIFINENKLVNGHFSWQEGYGSFTCGHQDINRLYKYIENQEEHHSAKSFKSEFISIIEENELEYSPDFLFDFH